ncbi:YciI family protein [uncultured Winogradskyella sp.]|uniref:YciI family protein n=1 Tax=uncultured Winogradskyella sp. TaxID=395353 RepID=UPI002637DD92|nr:YciI family protein [uncultured Winogradskyella sp.]
METNLFINYLTLTDRYKTINNWTDDTQQIIEAHGTFLKTLGEEGVLIFAGRTLLQPNHKNLFGIAVIKASSLDAAKQIFGKDPAIKAHIQQSLVLPFSMGIHYFDNLKE